MNRKIFIRAMLLPLLALSCTRGEAPDAGPSRPEDASPLAVYASINRPGKATSRADIWDVEDEYSYVGFTTGDIMGFYSSGGNWLDETGNGDFNNLKLAYEEGSNRFTDLDNGVEFSPSQMSGSQIFMYFPYEADMNGTGLPLRRKEDGRCVDLLSSNRLQLSGVVDGKNVALYGTFDHAFSELIIMRGEGFDRPPQGKERITAVLREPYTHVRVKVEGSGDTWSCTPELVYDDSASGLSDAEARRWDAWQGGNYGITTEDPDGTPAWYIVVPTLGSEVGQKKSGLRTYVEYIELFDNEGYLQRVSALRLSGSNTKYLDAGWRYPMEITMKELVPTVNPFKIVPWNDNVNLTDERARGINNESEFAQWVRAYNAYLLEPDDPQKIEALLRYGDSFVEAGQRSWHFYVLSDLDFTRYTPYDDGDTDAPLNGSVIIPQLQDVLDGISTTLVDSKFINHTIKGLTKTFIDELSGNGLVQHFDFVGPEVKNETATEPAGIIVNTMKTGTAVVNCNIENGDMLHPAGPAGMVVGQMTDGLVKECILSGFLVSSVRLTGDADKIAGAVSGSPTFTDNDADAVIVNN